MYPTSVFRMQPSRAFYSPAPRLRMIKKCPPELIPLGMLLYIEFLIANPLLRSVAVGAAIYASTKKLLTDKTLRLYRNSPESHDH
ncbi:hypothetical protein N7509_010101 [Penicillium cosmopolitanum]|uniref:Uncharacterized protein n=1 Tax=Penicillium cosmopolitanum TaxID=1131564 RepID=A0A9X0B4A5_9EURO|nr:uncharacterized protein N7509_010101 [Penicillium cosmopolitanum]KAJ5387560.1 hypothetical protein N7509_010101 [Penicillium cosmopolitanum]